jgi:hypothetical protein
MVDIANANPIDKVDRLSGAGLFWPLHPACEAWPEMLTADLSALADDIAANGLRDPVTLTPDGLLLDGRNRALACIMAGVEPATVVYDGDPNLFAISRNAHRRHMSQDHIAMVVAELVTMKPLGANQHEGSPIGLPSIARAAEEAGITETALKSAKVVHQHGTQEEVWAVKSGTVPLYKKADDVRKRRRALAPPAPPKPKPMMAQPTIDPIDVVACDILAKCSDGRHRPIAKIASTVKVAETAARDALTKLGPDCVTTRKNGSVIEYRIVRDDEADLRRLLAAKDEEIAILKSRIAEQDLEIERLTELLTAPTASDPPTRKKQRRKDIAADSPKPEPDSIHTAVH